MGFEIIAIIIFAVFLVVMVSTIKKHGNWGTGYDLKEAMTGTHLPGSCRNCGNKTQIRRDDRTCTICGSKDTNL